MFYPVFLVFVIQSVFAAGSELIKSEFAADEVSLLDYRYPVSIQLKNTKKHICSGAIVNVNQIATSCNCFCRWDATNRKLIKPNPSMYRIIFGTIEFVEPEAKNIAEIKEFFFHPDCGRFPSRLGWDYNFAIVVPVKSFYENMVIPMFSPPKVEAVRTLVPLKSGECKSLMWKVTDKTPNSTKLNVIELRIMPVDVCIMTTCQNTNLTCVNVADDDDHHICVVSVYEDQKLCEIDAGAPLICAGDVWAVADWRPDCSDGDTPALFSLVRSLIDVVDDENAASFIKPQFIAIINILIQILFH